MPIVFAQTAAIEAQDVEGWIGSEWSIEDNWAGLSLHPNDDVPTDIDLY